MAFNFKDALKGVKFSVLVLAAFKLPALMVSSTSAKEVSALKDLPETLKPFWQEYAAEFHSSYAEAQLISAKCWPFDSELCVVHYAEPLPSGWDTYLAVVAPNATEPMATLAWGKHDRLLGVELIFETLFVSVVSSDVMNAPFFQQVKLYQLVDGQFILLSETQSHSKKDKICQE